MRSEMWKMTMGENVYVDIVLKRTARNHRYLQAMQDTRKMNGTV